MPTVEPTKDGPLLLAGFPYLVQMLDGKELPCQGTVALCRCGASNTKPFCDGTHKTNGFSGDKDPDREPDRRDTYVGKHITIHDNRGLCAHAGRCTDGLPQVFGHPDPDGGFANPDAASRDEIVAVIKQCPSGALSYSIDGKEHRERGGPPFVGVAPNGPYVFRGGCEIKGAKLLAGATTDHFDLCRCGKSANKPFCSGAHWYVHFDKQAPKPADAE
ncbi:MAG: CDGSH iron-sulfur domain-containing protein [Planctomycetes bacterium]|nr:CDGSH iron-sulfur domain-containing protein [Planctomycetota bacterium]